MDRKFYRMRSFMLLRYQPPCICASILLKTVVKTVVVGNKYTHMLETELALADIAVGIRMLELITVPVNPQWLKQVKDMLACNPRSHPGRVTQHVCKLAIGRPPLQQHDWAAVTSARERLIHHGHWPARQGQGQSRSVVICNIPSVNPGLSLGPYRGAMCCSTR